MVGLVWRYHVTVDETAFLRLWLCSGRIHQLQGTRGVVMPFETTIAGEKQKEQMESVRQLPRR